VRLIQIIARLNFFVLVAAQSIAGGLDLLVVLRIERIPWFGLFLVWLVLAALLDPSGKYYDARLLDDRAAVPHETPTAAYTSWQRANAHGTAVPLLFVSTSGGGIRAAYWTAIGRFNPIASRRRAAASGLPSGPMMISAGSPGSTRTTTNTSSETTRRVTTKAAARLAMYPRTSLGEDPGYFAHETSERSNAGSGRSFQSPCRPFLVTASRGWM